jgi:hypothetical protein
MFTALVEGQNSRPHSVVKLHLPIFMMLLEMHVDRLFSSGISSFGKTPRQKQSTLRKEYSEAAVDQ